MTQFISAATLVVPDYDAALAFYVGQLDFELVDDTALSPGKRWVLVRPKGASESCLLLAKADGPHQTASIGAQTGGRVAFFLTTDDFSRDHSRFLQCGVEFLEPPRTESYGIVAVFRDPFGNLWDLIEPKR